MTSNILFIIIILSLAVFFILVVFKTHVFHNLKRWTVLAFALFVGGIMTLRYIADNEIHKGEREISVLCDLLHSEIDSIESISAIDKKLEYLSQSDRVLKQIDSIALSINEQKVFANIDLDSRLHKIRNIINHSKFLVESLNDTITIKNLNIYAQYEVTNEEMSIQKLSLSNESNLSFILKIYDPNLRKRAKAIYIVDTKEQNKVYLYKDKQNHFVLPVTSQKDSYFYKIGILAYNDANKKYTYYYIKIKEK